MKRFITDFIFTITLLFTAIAATILLYFSQDILAINNNLIAVQWCNKDDTRITNQNSSWYAIYLYSERNKNDSIMIKGWLIDYRTFSLWDPVRYEYTDILGEERSEAAVRENWSAINCLPHNQARVGRAGKLIQWGDQN